MRGSWELRLRFFSRGTHARISPPVPFCHIRLASHLLSRCTCATKTYNPLTDTSAISIPLLTSSTSNSTLIASATLWTPGRRLAPGYASPKATANPFLISMDAWTPETAPESYPTILAREQSLLRYCRSTPSPAPLSPTPTSSQACPPFHAGSTLPVLVDAPT